MIVQLKQIILFSLILCLAGQVVYPQDQKTRNNYTGAWETPESWDPVWPSPQHNVNNLDITINGYITANNSLSFSGSPCKLIVDDTLVIKGNLTVNNNNDVQVNDDGILIVWGNLTFSNQSKIIADGYIIVTGDLIKEGSTEEGEFDGDDEPVRVFIGGTISPAELTDDYSDFELLNCTSPSDPYQHSGCSYGNMEDIMNDPIYPFFQSTGITATLTSSDADNSFCAGTSVTFTAGGGTNYNFRVNGISVQNSGSTTYTTTTLTNGSIVDVIVSCSGGYTVTSPGITNTVFALPNATAASDSPVCSGRPLTLTGGPPGMASYLWTGPDGFTASTQSPTVSPAAAVAMTGNYSLTVTDTNGCTGNATQSVIVDKTPVANAGPDQELEYIFETRMKAELSFSETGEWSLISGSGRISDIHSPHSLVSELSYGENIFLWKVKNNSCEASAEVKITVHDLFIPSVITPDGDGKNDYFKVCENLGKINLIIFNRWGNEEYKNDDYRNDWDGRNNKGAELPYDTYFYILRFENGVVKKGSVLIKR